MKKLTTIAVIITIIMVNLVGADLCTLNDSYINVRLVPHFSRNNQEIPVFSNQQTFDNVYFEVNGSSNKNITNLIISTKSDNFNLNNNLANLNNESKILALSNQIKSTDLNGTQTFSVTINALLNNQAIYCSDSKVIYFDPIQNTTQSQNDPIGDIFISVKNNLIFYLVIAIIVLGILKYYRKI